MPRNALAALTISLLVGAAWACASGSGTSLGSTFYSAEDLSEARYESAYDFLKAHHRVRVSTAGSGGQRLLVRNRGNRDEDLSNAAVDQEGGRVGMTVDSSRPAGPGGESADEQSEAGQPVGSSGRYIAANLYIDDTEVAFPVSRLREISLDSIETIEILRPSEATSRYGGSGDAGGVALTLKDDDSLEEILQDLKEGSGGG